MLELYHWEPNGAWLKPLIALHEKGLEFRGRYVDVPALEQYAPEFVTASRETQLNQEGEGPLLIHDGRQITESLFMIEYLEDAFPDRPLRSEEPMVQARILAWGRFINEVLMPAANTLGCHDYLVPSLQDHVTTQFESRLARIPMQFLQDGWRAAIANDYSAELLEDSRRKVALAARRLEDALSQSEWLVAPTYSLADIDAFAICNSLPVLAPEIVSIHATPRLTDWLERIRTRPAVSAALRMSRTGQPERAFAPGPEHSRWG
jgi:glutathione S-transferase